MYNSATKRSVSFGVFECVITPPHPTPADTHILYLMGKQSCVTKQVMSIFSGQQGDRLWAQNNSLRRTESTPQGQRWYSQMTLVFETINVLKWHPVTLKNVSKTEYIPFYWVTFKCLIMLNSSKINIQDKGGNISSTVVFDITVQVYLCMSICSALGYF